jgi:hypothetical protein
VTASPQRAGHEAPKQAAAECGGHDKERERYGEEVQGVEAGQSEGDEDGMVERAPADSQDGFDHDPDHEGLLYGVQPFVIAGTSE